MAGPGEPGGEHQWTSANSISPGQHLDGQVVYVRVDHHGSDGRGSQAIAGHGQPAPDYR